MQKAIVPAPARWRCLAYLGLGLVIFGSIFAKIGGRLPDHYASLAISGVFTGLIMALTKMFLDPVFLGLAERKSKRLIARQFAVSITQVAVGVAAEGLLSAAASAGSGNDSPAGDFTAGGGGDFGGGGASGTF